jgi:hypothetical protein
MDKRVSPGFAHCGIFVPQMQAKGQGEPYGYPNHDPRFAYMADDEKVECQRTGL